MANISLINILLVAAGGAFGCSFRYIISVLLMNFNKLSSFPLATILVNVIGSFLIGILDYFIIYHLKDLSLEVRLAIVTGFLGGFTTFSAFSLDILKLLHDGQINMAFSYALLSVLLSIAAVFLGYYLMKSFSI